MAEIWMNLPNTNQMSRDDLEREVRSLRARIYKRQPAALLAVPPDGVKMLRETLCVAQMLIGQADARSLSGRRAEHSERLGLLIAECDVHRPLGPDGKHGERHTETCGCEDK